MRALPRLAKSLFLVGAAAAFLLVPGQPARAGDGADLGGLQASLDQICSLVNMNSCPQMPTISQAVLEIAALFDSPVADVRAYGAVPMGGDIDSSNPSRPPALNPSSSVSQIGTSFPIDPGVLSSLNPLAFAAASSSTGTATPVQLPNLNATNFFYGVASTITPNAAQPDTLFLFYEDPLQTTHNFASGQDIAKFSLPLTKLSVTKSGTSETAIPSVLKFKANKNLDCSTSILSGGVSGSATNNGINCAVVFAGTAIQPLPHAIFEVAVPLVITHATDPAYYNDFFDNFGSDPIFRTDLVPSASVGISPRAAPLGAAIPTGGTAIFPWCASLPTNNNPALPAVASFYAIATDGTALFSAPLPGSTTNISFACPAM